jgi:antitoxin (DNA-binding transcriptional repressor) of toxin-antitoxin stability system
MSYPDGILAPMGSPATVPPPPSDDRRHHEVSVREARMRLPHLVSLVRIGDQVTLLTDETGRPAAALVPVEAARTAAQTRAAQAQAADAQTQAADAQAQAAAAQAQAADARARAEASAAGWSRRLELLREQSRRRHEAELRTVVEALAEAWAELDARCPPGADAALDRLRAAHRRWLPRPR